MVIANLIIWRMSRYGSRSSSCSKWRRGVAPTEGRRRVASCETLREVHVRGGDRGGSGLISTAENRLARHNQLVLYRRETATNSEGTHLIKMVVYIVEKSNNNILGKGLL